MRFIFVVFSQNVGSFFLLHRQGASLHWNRIPSGNDRKVPWFPRHKLTTWGCYRLKGVPPEIKDTDTKNDKNDGLKNVASLKLTVRTCRTGHPQRKRSSSNHPFSGANLLLVSGRVSPFKYGVILGIYVSFFGV